MALPGNDLLSQIENENPKLGVYLRNYVLPSIQTTAQNAAVSPNGNIAAPQAPSAVSVAVAGEMMHVSITDNQPLTKGINYFTEIGVNDPNFTQPLVYHHGASRTPPPFPLPTLSPNPTNPGESVTQNYYVRSYSQYPGSPPSGRTVAGGGAAITMSGSTNLTLLPSNGSGTGTGTQGGSGFGKSPVRLPVSAKRSVSS